jgi:hypothetical protein
MVEATNSWAYVGAGLRILIELLGPEYSMEFSSLNTGLKVFLSREVTGGQGEDLVEKQNAEQGLMPVVENEPDIYGYIGEDRHMVEAFRHRRQPMETFHDGVAGLQRPNAGQREACSTGLSSSSRMLLASGWLRFGYLRVKQRKHVRRPLLCLGRPLNSPASNSPMVISPASVSPRPLRAGPSNPLAR